MIRYVNESPIEMMYKIHKLGSPIFYTWLKMPHRSHAENRRKILEFILEEHMGPPVLSELEKAFGKREFVRRRIPTEKDDASPLLL